MCKKNNNVSNDKDTKKYIKIGSITCVVVLIVWGLFLGVSFLCFRNWSDRGTFGDSFGAVNALFSGFAFAGLIVTLIMQREELQLQRQELAETRAEMHQQSLESKEQNKSIRLQRFENSFFNLIESYHSVVRELSYSYKTVSTNGIETHPLSGRKSFQAFYEHAYDGAYYGGFKNIFKDDTGLGFNEIENSYAFDHYFRHLYRIVKYVDETPLLNDEDNSDDPRGSSARYEYVSILRSLLSEYELIILFYNCLSSNGIAKFKPLLEKYSMFNNIRYDLIANPKHIVNYDSKAYNRYYVVDQYETAEKLVAESKKS